MFPSRSLLLRLIKYTIRKEPEKWPYMGSHSMLEQPLSTASVWTRYHWLSSLCSSFWLLWRLKATVESRLKRPSPRLWTQRRKLFAHVMRLHLLFLTWRLKSCSLWPRSLDEFFLYLRHRDETPSRDGLHIRGSTSYVPKSSLPRFFQLFEHDLIF